MLQKMNKMLIKGEIRAILWKGQLFLMFYRMFFLQLILNISVVL